MLIRCLFASVLLVLLAISSTRSFGHQFEVDGIMKASPEGGQPFSCSLQFYAQDDRWAAFQIWENPTNRIITEISDDGEYVYKITRAETNAGDFMPDDLSKALPGSWGGEIHPKHFPFKILNTEVVTLFYAYASSGYLDSHTNQMINPIPAQIGDEGKNPIGVHAAITRSAPPLRLPSRIIFQAEFQYVTNTIFTASGYTNIAGVQIPTKVSLARYLPDGANIVIAYEFQATRISEKCSLKSFKPPLPGHALVTDFRVRHFFASDPGSLRVTTNGWPAIQTN